MNLFLKIRNDIIAQRYSIVDFPVSYAQMQAMAESFIDGFMQLPVEIKKQFRHLMNPADQESVIGWVRKESEYNPEQGKTGDIKEYFHYSRAAPEVFEPLIKQDERIRIFFERMHPIYEAHENLMRHIVMSAAEAHKNPEALITRFFPKNGHPHFYSRVLAYIMRVLGVEIGKTHFDQGGLTNAGGESAEGLEIRNAEGVWVPMKYQEGKSVIMAGKLTGKIFEIEDFPGKGDEGSLHRVLQKKEDAYSNTVARWAAVCFFDTVDKNDFVDSADPIERWKKCHPEAY